jgi:hypothetical protein
LLWLAASRQLTLSAADPSAIFLVDHAWTYTTATARQALQEVEGCGRCVLTSI